MRLYVGLGANTGNRERNIQSAIEALDKRIGTLVRCSSLYETKPVGFSSEHLFLNAVAEFETELSPEALLEATQQVERALGRTVKSVAGVYADRPIDIDLLLLGPDVRVSLPDLELPHPRMCGRRFVMEPLAEIAPQLRHPLTGLTVKEMLAEMNRPRIALAEKATQGLADDVSRLVAQLSGTPHTVTPEALGRMLENPGTRLYLLRDEAGSVQGMATLCLCTSPTGTKAWVEDVVVDALCRRRGYARALVSHLCGEARRSGAKAVLLTSRPSRVAANALYVSLGFERRETNVYRISFDR